MDRCGVCAVMALAVSASCQMAMGAGNGGESPLRLPDGEPLAGVYFFPHWWQPWKGDDQAILRDMTRLRHMHVNTLLIDHEWSQALDRDWHWLDRSHRLAKQTGTKIVPWLSLKSWADVNWGRRLAAKRWYDEDIVYGLNQDGGRAAPLIWHPSTISFGAKYATAYIDRYLENGAILHLRWEGKDRPVVCLGVEAAWAGSFDEQSNLMFCQWLRGRYKDIKALNEAWGTVYGGFLHVDPRDAKIFDYAAHPKGKAKHPQAVEDHVAFRSKVVSDSLAAMAKRVRQKHPDVLFMAEIPYQYGSTHPHAVGYRIGYAANPESCDHADIVLFRATGPLNDQEIETLRKHRARTGQKFVLAFRTYSHWGNPRSPAELERFVAQRAEQAASLFNGLGFYSWNEMVDVHVAHSPQMANASLGPEAKRSAFPPEKSERAIKVLQAITQRYRQLVGARTKPMKHP